MTEPVLRTHHTQQRAALEQVDRAGEPRGCLEDAARAHEVDHTSVVAFVVRQRLLVHAVDLFNRLAHLIRIERLARCDLADWWTEHEYACTGVLH